MKGGREWHLAREGNAFFRQLSQLLLPFLPARKKKFPPGAAALGRACREKQRAAAAGAATEGWHQGRDEKAGIPRLIRDGHGEQRCGRP